LPPATFEDSPDAARHLVRVPGVALVVDGYNVTLSSWPGADLPMQRRRLVDSLAELAIRAGTEVLVVFDGVDDGNRLQLPASVRGRMRVRFTASEVEADEVIIALVDSMPVHRPVVVATNDRRVRDDAARKGANVITVDQLLAAIGRGSSPTG
jgi:predicted RNA-binding protein with PIN domain